MGLRNCLEFLKKRWTSFPYLESNTGSSSLQRSYYAEMYIRNNSACNGGRQNRVGYTFITWSQFAGCLRECSGITSHCQRYTQHNGDETLRFRKSNCNVITATDIVQIRQWNVKAFEEVCQLVFFMCYLTLFKTRLNTLPILWLAATAGIISWG